jgi:hypothetical protein
VHINRVWFACDVLILSQALRYGEVLFYRRVSRGLFLLCVPVTLACAFCAVLFVTYEFNDFDGKYAAFGQNFMMSILFVAMLVTRGSCAGQSLYIALCKMIGTLLPSFMFFTRHPDSSLLNFLYVGIVVFDLLYVVMVHRSIRDTGLNPWTRL